MLHKEMSLNNLDQINEKLKAHFVNSKYLETNVPVSSVRLPNDELDSIVPELTEQFQALGVEYDMIRTFTTKARCSSPIHIDGVDGDWKLLALNWPLYNCDQSHMIWYSLKPGVTDANLPNVPYKVTTFHNEDAVAVDKLILKKPTILRVDVPHNVANYSAENRLILSIRFKPEPMWLFD